MIYTVTLNPALDRTIVVDRLLDDDTTRVLHEKRYAAGKGINVSRVIQELGGKSVALGLVGGYDGLELEGLLINAGVLADFTKIGGETRTNIILTQKATRRQHVISAAGPKITASEIGQFYNDLQKLRDVSYMVLSGSLPKGVTSNLYGQIILANKKTGAFVLVDTDGDALRESILHQPTAMKPNRHELSRLVKRDLNDETDLLKACDEIHLSGVLFVLLSLGKAGLILSTNDRKIKAVAPPTKIGSSVGAGDSAVAGFIMAHSRGEDLAECTRLACAAGTATAKTPGTELCHRETVESLLPLVDVTDL